MHEIERRFQDFTDVTNDEPIAAAILVLASVLHEVCDIRVEIDKGSGPLFVRAEVDNGGNDFEVSANVNQ